MAQVMEPHVSALCAAQHLFHFSVYALRIIRRILFDRRGKYPFRFRLCLPFAQELQYRGRQDQHPVARFRFRRGDLDPAVDMDCLPAHVQFSRAEIQILPPQGADLAAAQAGRKLREGDLIKTVLFRLDQEPPHLVLRQRFHLRGFFRRQLAPDRRIRPDQPFLHRLLQRRSAGSMTGAYHPIGQPRSVKIDVRQTAVLFQIGVKPLQVVSLQRVQPDRTDRGNNVLVDALFVTALRGRAQRRF